MDYSSFPFLCVTFNRDHGLVCGDQNGLPFLCLFWRDWLSEPPGLVWHRAALHFWVPGTSVKFTDCTGQNDCSSSHVFHHSRVRFASVRILHSVIQACPVPPLSYLVPQANNPKDEVCHTVSPTEISVSTFLKELVSGIAQQGHIGPLGRCCLGQHGIPCCESHGKKDTAICTPKRQFCAGTFPSSTVLYRNETFSANANSHAVCGAFAFQLPFCSASVSVPSFPLWAEVLRKVCTCVKHSVTLGRLGLCRAGVLQVQSQLSWAIFSRLNRPLLPTSMFDLTSCDYQVKSFFGMNKQASSFYQPKG